MVNCICDYGRRCVKQAVYLKNGDAKSCGICSNHSIGERIIQKFLEEHNIKFSHEFSFEDLKSDKDGYLRFDFAILNENNSLDFLIEYDGEQHYVSTPNPLFEPYEELHARDLMKNEYCEKNNIKLVRIKYNENLNKRLREIFSDYITT